MRYTLTFFCLEKWVTKHLLASVFWLRFLISSLILHGLNSRWNLLFSGFWLYHVSFSVFATLLYILHAGFQLRHILLLINVLISIRYKGIFESMNCWTVYVIIFEASKFFYGNAVLNYFKGSPCFLICFRSRHKEGLKQSKRRKL
jgi:hypothetical protein